MHSSKGVMRIHVPAGGPGRQECSRVRARGLPVWATVVLVSMVTLLTLGWGPPPRAGAAERVGIADASARLLPSAAPASRGIGETYGRLPLYFEANRGQSAPEVKFLSRGAGYTMFLTPREAVLVLHQGAPPPREAPEVRRPTAGTALRMSFLGGNAEPRLTGREELAGKVNYFVGKDPAKWRTQVTTYRKVHYQDLYPGIDLVFYGTQRQLEYDFVVAAGADPGRIVLDIPGADKVEVDAAGDLLLHFPGGVIRQRKPMIYQEVDGVRREIAGGYTMKGPHQVAFRIAAYDRKLPLVIDPVLVYSTFLGGSGVEEGFGIAVDAAGSAHVTGRTTSANFPTTAGAFDLAFDGGTFDAFVTKLDPAGATLLYSTYLGGSGFDQGAAIAVDAAGSAYVTDVMNLLKQQFLTRVEGFYFLDFGRRPLCSLRPLHVGGVTDFQWTIQDLARRV